MNEYRSSFPDSVVQRLSVRQREKLSHFMKEKLRDSAEYDSFMKWRSFPSEIKHWIRKGFSEDKAREKIAEFQRKQSLKGNNELTHAKRSAKTKGSNNPMSLISIAKRAGVSEVEASKLTPCFGRTGEKHPMFGKKHTEEAIKKIGQHINHSGRSKIEHEMSNELIALYGGEKNAYVVGWCCDYVNYDNRLVVEFFGDFWHHNPLVYESTFINKLTKRSSNEVWDRDARKLQEIRDAGYEVVVIWETDWRRDKQDCIERVKDAYDRTL